MRLAAGHGHWNLAVRRAQEVVELTAKGLLNDSRGGPSGSAAPSGHVVR
jgi:HEPN domain-containing protein